MKKNTYIERKELKPINELSSVVYDLPSPANLSKMWNFGSLLGLCLVIQIGSGLLLSVHYTPSTEGAFLSVIHIMRDVEGGWLIRSVHANGASIFFILIYIHIGRGIYYMSFYVTKVWMVGCVMFVLLMMIAFTGYVLPWGQMSFWGATVITNLLTAIPYVGESLVEWVWGGICVGDPTLKRFFTFHFAAPFLLAVLSGVHIILLHDSGSSNPLGVYSGGDMIPFHPYYSVKDMFGAVLMLIFYAFVVLFDPDMFLDPANFYPADPMSTPAHIEPEWYFLFFYTILRSIDNKVGGVMALVLSILMLFLLPLFPRSVFSSIQHNCVSQSVFFFLVGDFILMTFLGKCPVEEPFISVGFWAMVAYYLFFVFYPISLVMYEEVLFLELVDEEKLRLGPAKLMLLNAREREKLRSKRMVRAPKKKKRRNSVPKKKKKR